jgi:hypothetical protein
MDLGTIAADLKSLTDTLPIASFLVISAVLLGIRLVVSSLENDFAQRFARILIIPVMAVASLSVIGVAIQTAELIMSK